MRAVVAPVPGGPEVLRLLDVPRPEPADGQVLIRVIATSVNRADLNQRAGRSSRAAYEILGLEVSGYVAAVGRIVTDWKVDDRVCTLLDSGGYAEYTVADAELLIRVPDSLDMESAGAFAEIFLTAFDALDSRAHLAAGETLLVHGAAGGLGTASIQMGMAMGARVFATVRQEHQRTACEALGATVIVIGDPAGPHSWPEELRTLNGGGADVVLDVLGADAWESNVGVLADDGRLVVLGTLTGSDVSVDLKTLMRRRLSVLAATMRGRPPGHKAMLVERFTATCGEAMAAGRLHPLVADTFDLSEVSQAHAALERGGHIGKIVIRMSSKERE